MLLLLITLLGVTQPKEAPLLGTLTTSLLCLAMGAQNALVTRLSGAVVRTTHLTGVVTDLGIEAVRFLGFVRTTFAGHAPWTALRLAIASHRAPEFQRIRLLSAILGSFLAGAVLGPWLYVRQGASALIVPALVLLALVLFDHLVGLGHPTVATAPGAAPPGAEVPKPVVPPAPPN
jgi:uncharacterized membrane protein YoaK (UPF0700 family)